MIRTFAALLVAASIPVLAASEAAAKHRCNSCGEEIPQVTRNITDRNVGDLGAWFGAPMPSDASRAFPRRRAHFYAWQSGCYALDRSRQWRWVDPALC
jgi:hypothetical protein